MKVTFNKLSDDTTEQWSQNPFNKNLKEFLSFFQLINLAHKHEFLNDYLQKFFKELQYMYETVQGHMYVF